MGSTGHATGRAGLIQEALTLAVGAAQVQAGDAARRWLARCAGFPVAVQHDAGEQHLDGAVDLLLERAWRGLPPQVRIELGSVFTPREVAKQLLVEMGFPRRSPRGLLLDPACGGGSS